MAVEVRVSTPVFSWPCDERRWSDDAVSWGFSLSVDTDAVWGEEGEIDSLEKAY